MSIGPPRGKKRKRTSTPGTPTPPQPKGHDFWSMVDKWFTTCIQQLGTPWTSPGWTRYIDETIERDRSRFTSDANVNPYLNFTSADGEGDADDGTASGGPSDPGDMHCVNRQQQSRKVLRSDTRTNLGCLTLETRVIVDTAAGHGPEILGTCTSDDNRVMTTSRSSTTPKRPQVRHQDNLRMLRLLKLGRLGEIAEDPLSFDAKCNVGSVLGTIVIDSRVNFGTALRLSGHSYRGSAS
ncbi:hypothetical protein H4582DRAFT_2156597 [Lactarius indigo]|nr:hypothetical protein H4582DRAFT_2156597 [Lactarius indigo]